MVEEPGGVGGSHGQVKVGKAVKQAEEVEDESTGR